MLRPRTIPVLSLRGSGLVKTIKFDEAKYLGDPRNAVRIFNEKEVDELVLVDIDASREGRGPRFDLLSEIVSEAFMPIAYGGGVRNEEQATELLRIGIEKVILCSALATDPGLVDRLSKRFGVSTIVAAIDYRRNWRGKPKVMAVSGRDSTGRDPVEWAREIESRGVGEIILTSIDHDGTMQGYDWETIRAVAGAVRIPVVANGGASSIADLGRAVRSCGASAAAASSLFVFKGPRRAVLINFPSPADLDEEFNK